MASSQRAQLIADFADPIHRRAVARSRWLMTAVLALAVFGCLGMLAFRASRVNYFDMRFLVWNLFLAVVPYPFAWLTDVMSRRGVRSVFLVPSGAVWLAFFPNGPYLVTDLIHLTEHGGVPLWFDGLVFFAFASTGLLLALVSLYLMQSVAERRKGPVWSWSLALLAIALGAYGIYLGRVERWNSWDIWTHPSALFRRVRSQVIDPATNRQAIILSVGFAVFLSAIYVLMRSFAHLVSVDNRKTTHRQ